MAAHAPTARARSAAGTPAKGSAAPPRPAWTPLTGADMGGGRGVTSGDAITAVGGGTTHRERVEKQKNDRKGYGQGSRGGVRKGGEWGGLPKRREVGRGDDPKGTDGKVEQTEEALSYRPVPCSARRARAMPGAQTPSGKPKPNAGTPTTPATVQTQSHTQRQWRQWRRREGGRAASGKRRTPPRQVHQPPPRAPIRENA